MEETQNFFWKIIRVNEMWLYETVVSVEAPVISLAEKRQESFAEIIAVFMELCCMNLFHKDTL